MEQQIYLIGLNYRTAGVEVRERFALTDHCSKDTWAIPLRPSGENDSAETTLDEALAASQEQMDVLAARYMDFLSHAKTERETVDLVVEALKAAGFSKDFKKDLVFRTYRGKAVFVARKGFDYGWMDVEGNWIYCQSIFTSTSDETNNYFY